VVHGNLGVAWRHYLVAVVNSRLTSPKPPVPVPATGIDDPSAAKRKSLKSLAFARARAPPAPIKDADGTRIVRSQWQIDPPLLTPGSVAVCPLVHPGVSDLTASPGGVGPKVVGTPIEA
jgi:hypothetical protein